MTLFIREPLISFVEHISMFISSSPCMEREFFGIIDLISLPQYATYCAIHTSFSCVIGQVFTEGITNTLLGCYQEGDFENLVLVRVNGEGSGLIINREGEPEVMNALHAAGCAPPMFGLFNNGMAYGFFVGETLDEKSVRDPHIQRLVNFFWMGLCVKNFQQPFGKLLKLQNDNSKKNVLKLSGFSPYISFLMPVSFNFIWHCAV